MSEPVVGDRGLTWNQLREVPESRQVIAKRLSSEMDAAHQRDDYYNRERLRRRLTSMLP